MSGGGGHTSRATGRLILVVGPSGAGKDSLIQHARQELAADARFDFPRRIVTRPASDAENNIEVDGATFADLSAKGAFLASWDAHGLHYAIPADVEVELAAGRQVICNVSRTVVRDLKARCRNVLVIEVTAPPAILAMRLIARGRAADGDAGGRLARSARLLASEPADVTILNDGPLQVACDTFMKALLPEPA